MMWRRLSLALATGLLLTGGAHATSTISCESVDGDASIVIGLGTVPGMAVISADIEAGGGSMSMESDALAVSQAFSDGDTMKIDFTDANLSQLLARLRLFQANEEDDYVMAGTLEVVGVGAYAVTCEGP